MQGLWAAAAKDMGDGFGRGAGESTAISTTHSGLLASSGTGGEGEGGVAQHTGKQHNPPLLGCLVDKRAQVI